MEIDQKSLDGNSLNNVFCVVIWPSQDHTMQNTLKYKLLSPILFEKKDYNLILFDVLWQSIFEHTSKTNVTQHPLKDVQ